MPLGGKGASHGSAIAGDAQSNAPRPGCEFEHGSLSLLAADWVSWELGEIVARTGSNCLGRCLGLLLTQFRLLVQEGGTTDGNK